MFPSTFVSIFRVVFYEGFITKTSTFLKMVTKCDRNMQVVYDACNAINGSVCIGKGKGKGQGLSHNKPSKWPKGVRVG